MNTLLGNDKDMICSVVDIGGKLSCPCHHFVNFCKNEGTSCRHIKNVKKEYTMWVQGSTGNVYSVGETEGVMDCDCPHFVYRCKGNDVWCKHIVQVKNKTHTLAPPKPPALPFPSHTPVVQRKVQQVTGSTGNVYSVGDTEGVMDCDCPHFVYRCKGNDVWCKHIKEVQTPQTPEIITLPPTPVVQRKVQQVTGSTGNVYSVGNTEGVMDCDCPHFVYKCKGNGTWCKHIKEVQTPQTPEIITLPPTLVVQRKVQQVTGSTGNVYSVGDTEGVMDCDCPHFSYRCKGNGTWCKHIKEVQTPQTPDIITLPPTPVVQRKVQQVSGSTGNVYSVGDTEGVMDCDCPHFVYRCKGNGVLCKHIKEVQTLQTPEIITLPPTPVVQRKVQQVTGSTGNVYSVGDTKGMMDCDCPHFVYRCKGNGVLCKHIKEVQTLQTPEIITLPPTPVVQRKVQQVTGSTGNVYSVGDTKGMMDCDCPHFVYRCKGNGVLCKHIKEVQSP